MNAVANNWLEIIARMPAESAFIAHNIAWDEYEELLSEVGEASGLRISYYRETLQIMTLSPKHERYGRLFEKIMGILSLRLKMPILSFGSMTMRTRRDRAGKEPDACFYIQSAPLIGNRDNLDFAVDPPPDIVLEIDIHHDSLAQFPLYVALGVPEIWRYDGKRMRIYLLSHGCYGEIAVSQALPILTAEHLTALLVSLRDDGEFATLTAFDEWLSYSSRKS